MTSIADGAAAAQILKDIIVVGLGSSPQNWKGINGTLCFSPDGETSGKELWKSDGTEPGTVRVKDTYPGAGDSSPDFLPPVGYGSQRRSQLNPYQRNKSMADYPSSEDRSLIPDLVTARGS